MDAIGRRRPAWLERHLGELREFGESMRVDAATRGVVACGRCSFGHCCRQTVSVSSHEAVALVMELPEVVHAAWPAILGQARHEDVIEFDDRSADRLVAVMQDGRGGRRLEPSPNAELCALRTATGRCGVYRARPVVCAAYFVIGSESQACAGGNAGLMFTQIGGVRGAEIQLQQAWKSVPLGFAPRLHQGLGRATARVVNGLVRLGALDGARWPGHEAWNDGAILTTDPGAREWAKVMGEGARRVMALGWRETEGVKPASHLRPWQELECPACGLVVDGVVVRRRVDPPEAVCEECGAVIKPLPATAEVLRRVARRAP